MSHEKEKPTGRQRGYTPEGDTAPMSEIHGENPEDFKAPEEKPLDIDAWLKETAPGTAEARAKESLNDSRAGSAKEAEKQYARGTKEEEELEKAA